MVLEKNTYLLLEKNTESNHDTGAATLPSLEACDALGRERTWEGRFVLVQMPVLDKYEDSEREHGKEAERDCGIGASYRRHGGTPVRLDVLRVGREDSSRAAVTPRLGSRAASSSTSPQRAAARGRTRNHNGHG